MEIEYDTEIEVTATQYRRLMTDFAEIIAGRRDGDRYYIKLWMMKYKEKLRKALCQTVDPKTK